jgi:hypothetical protein
VIVEASTYSRSESVVRREVAGETFLVPLHGRLADLQELFVLNEVGRWVWENLDGRRLEELGAGLCAEFEIDAQQAQRDAESFVKELVEAGLATNNGPQAMVP